MNFTSLSWDWADIRIPGEAFATARWFGEVVKSVTNGKGAARQATAPPKAGYRFLLESSVPVAGGRLSLLADHPSSPGWAMVQASGQASGVVMPLISDLDAHYRRVGETHEFEANRRDAALDFECSEADFDELFQEAARVCARHEKRHFPMGESAFGRTIYFNWKQKTGLEAKPGQKAPQYQARLYEKGKQLGQNPEWRRFEVICRPDKHETKHRLYLAEPGNVLAGTPWARDFLDVMGYESAGRALNLSAAKQEEDALSKVMRAKLMHTLGHMADQYGNTVKQLVDLVGEEEARRLVETALFSPTGSGGPELKRMAQAEYTSSFGEDFRGWKH